LAVALDILVQSAEDLIKEADNFRPGLLEPGVREVPERLRKGRLTLAVLGQFKRGKSTLINALLGAEVLPTSVLPLTSVVTSVVHGDSPALTVRFQDSREEAHPVESLARFVTEEENPRNAKGVAWARVQWPSPFLARPVRVVDTPGVGSVYDHNTEASDAFLSHLDAAVFVLGVDPILTETELEWLGRVKDRAEAFFFVLNKTDQLTQEEVGQVFRFTQERLSELWGRPGKLFPLSAKRALQSPEDPVFVAFRDELERFLDREGDETLLRSAKRKLQRGSNGLLSALAIEREAARRPAEELQARLTTLAAEEERLALDRPRAYWVLEETSSRIMRELKAIIEERWEAEKESVNDEVRGAWASATSVGDGRMAMMKVLESRLERLFKALREKAEELSQERFEQALLFLAREYQALSDKLLETAGEWFGLALSPVALEIPEPPRSRFYVLVPPELVGVSSAGGSIVNLLPKRWAERWALEGFLKQVDLFHGMQRDRLISDLAERYQERTGHVAVDLSSHVKQVLEHVRESVQRGLAIQSGTEEARERALEDLASRETRVKSILARIEATDAPALPSGNAPVLA
jgi:GTP-binding protein EngB required for normal cell division